jgi:AcrR family transcriptional regulator
MASASGHLVDGTADDVAPQERSPAGLLGAGTVVDADDVDDIRQRLLDAALVAFTERGYERVRVSDIAAEAGLSVGVLYTRFADKAQLLAEALAQYAGETTRMVRARVETDLGPDPAAAAVVLATLVSEPAASSDRLVVDAMAAAAREPSAAEALVSELAATRATVRDRVERARRQGNVDADLDPDALASVLHATVVGAMALRAVGLPTPDHDAVLQVTRRMMASFAPTQGRSR